MTVFYIESLDEYKAFPSNLSRLDDPSLLKHTFLLFSQTAFYTDQGLHAPFITNFPKTLSNQIKIQLLKNLERVDESVLRELCQADEVSQANLLIKLSLRGINRLETVNLKMISSFNKLPSLRDCFELINYDRLDELSQAKKYLLKKISPEITTFHNIGAIIKLILPLIKMRIKDIETPTNLLLTLNPPIKEILRIDGTKILIISTGKFAKETGDIRFVFGQGDDFRQCPFKYFLIPFLEKIRNLKEKERK